MIIITFISLSLILILFRILRGESIAAIAREIKELRAQDVPHFFLRSLKIVFSFKPGYTRKQKKAHEQENSEPIGD